MQRVMAVIMHKTDPCTLMNYESYYRLWAKFKKVTGLAHISIATKILVVLTTIRLGLTYQKNLIQAG